MQHTIIVLVEIAVLSALVVVFWLWVIPAAEKRWSWSSNPLGHCFGAMAAGYSLAADLHRDRHGSAIFWGVLCAVFILSAILKGLPSKKAPES